MHKLQQIKHYAPIAIGLCLVLATGVVHGLQTGRWRMDDRLEAAAKRLDIDNIPQRFGDWSSSEGEISARELAGAGAVGHLSRTYTNRANGQMVSVMILCGRHGPISVHPPTVCFTGSGWTANESPRQHDVQDNRPGTTDRFWTVDFVKMKLGVTQRLRTYWAWSDGSRWEAPEHPRLRYAGEPFLYKLYLTVLHADDSNEHDAAAKTIEDFMEDFLPILDNALSPDGSQVAHASD